MLVFALVRVLLNVADGRPVTLASIVIGSDSRRSVPPVGNGVIGIGMVMLFVDSFGSVWRLARWVVSMLKV